MTVSLMTQGSTILGASVLSAEAENLSAEGEAASGADSTNAAASGNVGSLLGGGLLIPLIFLVALYLLIFRPQKKQEKQAEQMRAALQIGDEVVTIGGIVGIIVRVSDDTVLLESGGDRNKLRIKTAAISENLTAHEETARIKSEKAAATAKKKSEKKPKADDEA